LAIVTTKLPLVKGFGFRVLHPQRATSALSCGKNPGSKRETQAVIDPCCVSPPELPPELPPGPPCFCTWFRLIKHFTGELARISYSSSVAFESGSSSHQRDSSVPLKSFWMNSFPFGEFELPGRRCILEGKYRLRRLKERVGPADPSEIR